MVDDRPIGVFDSGVGGLTVARAIWELLPNESVVYVGDGAHFPYGPRPLEEIRRFAMGIAEHLLTRGVKLLVVACNSIEVSAIGDIAAAAEVPVVGVIGPGVRAALRATRNGVIGVIGTEATIRTGGYQRAVGSAADAPLRRPVRSSWSTWNGGTRRAPRCGRPRQGILHRWRTRGSTR